MEDTLRQILSEIQEIRKEVSSCLEDVRVIRSELLKDQTPTGFTNDEDS